MNLSRCGNGHFFDKEKFSTCPYCAQGAKTDESLTTVFTEDMGDGIGETVPLDGMGGDRTPEIKTIPATEVTGRIQGTNGGGIVAIDPTETVDVKPPVTLGNLDLADMSMDDDHTVGIYSEYFDEPNTGRIIPAQQLSASRITTPCVGWLVAASGNHIGQDFRLKTGKNFIGRDQSMDVVLDGDKSVSRNKHAIVVYEPKKHLYLVQPGESSELVYLNDQVVLQTMKLSAYDIITVGDVNLLFMPLCSEKFNWTDTLRKNV